MSKLPKLTGKKLAKIAEKIGFKHSHTRGSHMVFKHIDGRKAVIPHHSGEEIGPGLLLKIIKQDFKLTREEFLKLI